MSSLLISTMASRSHIIPFLPQARSIFTSTTSSQDTEPEFCNEILRFHVWSTVKTTFSETCEHMLDDISSTTDVARLSKRVERYLYMPLCARATLISLQLCGFCGGDGCTVKLDCTGHKQFKIISSCHYDYVSFNYEGAKLPTKSSCTKSSCTNVPIAYPYCNSPDAVCFIWKYNAVTHGGEPFR